MPGFGQGKFGGLFALKLVCFVLLGSMMGTAAILLLPVWAAVTGYLLYQRIINIGMNPWWTLLVFTGPIGGLFAIYLMCESTGARMKQYRKSKNPEKLPVGGPAAAAVAVPMAAETGLTPERRAPEIAAPGRRDDRQKGEKVLFANNRAVFILTGAVVALVFVVILLLGMLGKGPKVHGHSASYWINRLKDGDPHTRIEAFEILWRCDDGILNSAESDLLRLADSDKDTRDLAVQLLAKIYKSERR